MIKNASFSLNFFKNFSKKLRIAEQKTMQKNPCIPEESLWFMCNSYIKNHKQHFFACILWEFMAQLSPGESMKKFYKYLTNFAWVLGTLYCYFLCYVLRNVWNKLNVLHNFGDKSKHISYLCGF